MMTLQSLLVLYYHALRFDIIFTGHSRCIAKYILIFCCDALVLDIMAHAWAFADLIFLGTTEPRARSPSLLL